MISDGYDRGECEAVWLHETLRETVHCWGKCYSDLGHGYLNWLALAGEGAGLWHIQTPLQGEEFAQREGSRPAISHGKEDKPNRHWMCTVTSVHFFISLSFLLPFLSPLSHPLLFSLSTFFPSFPPSLSLRMVLNWMWFNQCSLTPPPSGCTAGRQTPFSLAWNRGRKHGLWGCLKGRRENPRLLNNKELHSPKVKTRKNLLKLKLLETVFFACYFQFNLQLQGPPMRYSMYWMPLVMRAPSLQGVSQVTKVLLPWRWSQKMSSG